MIRRIALKHRTLCTSSTKCSNDLSRILEEVKQTKLDIDKAKNELHKQIEDFKYSSGLIDLLIVVNLVVSSVTFAVVLK